MPKKYGFKEKDQVVSHILNLVLTGQLRSGDRVDRNEIAHGLGVSRVPIQEALVQLEHDGIVSTRYHRGAFVERFDEATVLEHHELDGLLNGIASARAAANPTPRILGELDALMRALRTSMESRTFADVASEYRRTVNDEYAGPRLHATIRASQNLIPRVFWATYQKNGSDDILPFYEDENSAIHRRDPEAARAACVGRSHRMAQTMLAELVRRQVLVSPDGPQTGVPDPLRMPAGLDATCRPPSIAL
ncbi:GntR family transcriptional regulator [Mycobacterium haemophilum]|uniref:GntR family transcriptional regulator n=1 Tax=Mycobacterium haemophilum TaxID=29311 RepID=A0A0I9XP80_9MYCO|nr:GntR family transcriptional regulator [Mycobacterium haemophilum]AKN15649.1 GntR family transcriptional regulator [Mycobacterium haemophilum DSM 44634]KLO28677.1 GntR family transcriptional regulator [Mycobacterium haemophilum]KLO35473.1 GntR family transcriptional regulator [Mycobacterium haemophilum]KLO40708.1 GntR family transcriptional regulator [Mycobacterium haemophilum]KLO48176.1 GntR family transcriptional regulator [Mycobacterium haemophilum]